MVPVCGGEEETSQAEKTAMQRRLHFPVLQVSQQ